MRKDDSSFCIFSQAKNASFHRCGHEDNDMKNVLTFKTIAFDTHALLAGVTIPACSSLEYFNPNYGDNDNDVTKKHEKEIIKWIVASPPAKELLLSELGVGPDPFIDCSVRQPVIENPQGKPGDIDLLICDGHEAEHAIAFQCKRVVVTALNEADDNVNKISDIKDAVNQANKQKDRLGFHRNYLGILIETYGKKREQTNVLFRGSTQETFKKIYEFPQRESLSSDVGVVFIEISQPTGKSFDRMVVVGICIDQHASRLDQPTQLTNRIKDLMRRK